MFRATTKCNVDRWITCVISRSTGITGASVKSKRDWWPIIFIAFFSKQCLVENIQGKFQRKRNHPQLLFLKNHLKTSALGFSIDGKHFENRAFRKRWRHDNSNISLPKLNSNTNQKWLVIVAFSNSSGVLLTRKTFDAFSGVIPPFSNSSGEVRTTP